MQTAPSTNTDQSRGYMPPRPEGRIISITPGTIWLVTGIVVATAIITYIVARAIDIFVVLFIAIIFAEAIRPLMDWLHRRHIPRPVAVLLIYLAILAIIAFLVWLLVRPIIAQIGDLQQHLPQYERTARQFFDTIQRTLGNNPRLAQVLQQVQGQLGGLLSGVVQYLLFIPVGITVILGGIVAVVAMAFFWLTGSDNLRPFVISLFPERGQARAVAVFDEMGVRLGGYVRGVVMNMFIIGTLSGLGNFFLQVPYAILLGILAGAMEVIPYIGPWVSGAAAVLVALVTTDVTKAVEVAIFYVALQVIEGHTVVPLVMNRAVHIDPLTVIFAVLVGGTLFGIVGGILAVPVAAVLKVVITEVLAPAARSAAHKVTAARTAPPSSPPPDANGGQREVEGTTPVPA